MNAFFRSLARLVQDPTSNLTATAIGVSIVVIALLIVVLALIAVALPAARGVGKKRVRPKKAASVVSPRIKKRLDARGKILVLTILGLGVVVGFGALYVVTSTDAFCTRTCHSMQVVEDAWEHSAHGRISCIRCHEGQLGLSLPNAVVQRARSVYLELRGPDGYAIGVPSERCLQCHAEIAQVTIISGRGVAMSHREALDGGGACVDCHGSQGHTAGVLTTGMNACLRCHDGTVARADCTVCHPRGVEYSIRLSDNVFGSPARLPAPPSCGGCHSEASCDKCHGLRLPHPAGYGTAAGHAKAAAFDRKVLCYRCHAVTDCQRCHMPFTAHQKDWNRAHAAYPRATTWCSNCHETQNFCAVCH